MFVRNLRPTVTNDESHGLFRNIEEIVVANRALKQNLDNAAGQGVEASANAILQSVSFFLNNVGGSNPNLLLKASHI